MPTVRTTLTGAFPRTEALVQATRDLDRGRTTPAAAEAVFAEAERQVLAVESDLGLDVLTGGYVRWPDLFRPFTASWNGVGVGPLTRFFETNTFFRQPVLDAPPTPGKSALAAWLPHGPRSRWVLPGPYTFSYLAEVRYGEHDRTTALKDIARALATELRRLAPNGPAEVQFQEPLLGYAPFEGDPTVLIAAYRLLSEALGSIGSSVWTFFGDAGRSFSTLVQLPVGTIGVDVFESEIPAGASLKGRGLGLGVIESRTTLPEDLAELTPLVQRWTKALGPSTVWLGPSPPLDLLPFDAAVSKLALLPRLKEALQP